MFKFLSVHKKKVVFLSIIILLTSSIKFELFGFKDFLYKSYPNLSLHKEIRNNKYLREHIYNDYNTVFLPKTQYEKLKIIKNKIKFKPEYYKRYSSTKGGIATPRYGSFFIEIFKENLWLVDYMGTVYQIDKDEINFEDFKEISPKIINTNFESNKVLDIFIHNKKLYISTANEIDNCKKLEIFVAELNSDKLNFKKFFSPKECGDLIFGGKMQFYKHNNLNGIIFTSHGHKYNEPDNTPQDNNSIYGKVLFVDFKSRDLIIFSKGHRLSQGLFVENDLILQTEHGPRGGDEINRIIFQKNYGWPITSYGEKYFLDFTEEPSYKKDHHKNGFKEPIYSFVKSIGISEIIKLPNAFSKHFQDNFIISSLYGRHIYRVKFSNLFDRVLYMENIYVGERIRDIKFHNKLNLILLAFEENGEIGIISNSLK
jgi:hypothetical protein